MKNNLCKKILLTSLLIGISMPIYSMDAARAFMRSNSFKRRFGRIMTTLGWGTLGYDAYKKIQISNEQLAFLPTSEEVENKNKLYVEEVNIYRKKNNLKPINLESHLTETIGSKNVNNIQLKLSDFYVPCAMVTKDNKKFILFPWNDTKYNLKFGLDKKETQAIIWHEYGHLKNNDQKNRLLWLKYSNLFFYGVTEFFNRYYKIAKYGYATIQNPSILHSLSKIPKVGALLISNTLNNLAYCRFQEYRADDTIPDHLAKDAAIFFEKEEKEQHWPYEKWWEEFLQPHPSHTKRAARLRKRAERYEASQRCSQKD